MKKVLTGCPGDCGGSCPILAHVQDGRVVRVSPEEWWDCEERPQLRPCVIGLASAQRVHHPDRLRHPLVRVGERGQGGFRQASWDEALEILASELLRVKQQYGPEAVLGLMGAGNVKGVLRSTGALGRRFLNAFGGQTATRSSISNESAIFASRHTFGLGVPPPRRESLMRTRLFVMWGINPSETIQGTNTSWYLAQAREAGARFIFVDPRFTNSAAALADQWIPIRPGTDTAMLIAMANVFIREGLCDEGFLERCAYGFERYRDYCIGLTDGTQKTPEWAEAICGVPARTIAALAREYATTRPADLWSGWGPGRTAVGEQFHRACIALAAMTGNIGIPGGGAGCYLGQDLKKCLGVVPIGPGPNPTGRSVVGWRWADAVLQGRSGGYPGDIKMIISVGGARLNQCGDINKGIRAMEKVEFMAVLEQFMTPLARYADLVLPVTTQFEHEDAQLSKGGEAYMFHSGQAIAPVGESLSDVEIFVRLARRLSMENFGPDSVERWLCELLQDAPVSLGDIRERGVFWDKESRGEPLQEFVRDPEANPLPTQSGKIEIYSQSMAQMEDPESFPPIPTYTDSWEGPRHPLADRYPLLLVTCHSGRRIHSMFYNVPWLDELEPHTLWINPMDARERSVRDGDRVQVFNDIGCTLIQARVTERVMPGVVAAYQGTWFRLDENGKDLAGSVNMVCKDTTSPGEAAATNAVLVQVAGLEG